MKLDIKFSQYCKPVAAEAQSQDVSFTEEEGTVKLQVQGESEAMDTEDIHDVEFTINKTEGNVVYIYDVDQSSIDVISGGEVSTTPTTQTVQASSTTAIEVNKALAGGQTFQIQTDEGTIFHIPDLASIPEISEVMDSTSTQTIIIQSQPDNV